MGLKKPRLYVKVDTNFSEKLRIHLKILDEIYTPTWWCPFGFAQTAVRQLLRSKPSMPWEREVIEFADGGASALDWLHPLNEAAAADPKTPLVLFFPGITGSTHESTYLLHAALEAHQRGWRVACTNARGLGGVPLRTPKFYSANYTDDVKEVIQFINKKYPDSKKLGCGFSLGGMILFNYLYKCASEKEAGLDGGLIVSAPWNSLRSTESIESLFPGLFVNRAILNALLKLVRPYILIVDRYHSLFEHLIDWERLMGSRTLRDFDTAFIVPLFGYKDYLEYYEDSALYYKVGKIPIPLLALQSDDDVFAPTDSLPFDRVCRSENVAICFTKHGGHTAFMQGSNPNDPGFVEKILVQYGDLVFSDDESTKRSQNGSPLVDPKELPDN